MIPSTVASLIIVIASGISSVSGAAQPQRCDLEVNVARRDRIRSAAGLNVRQGLLPWNEWVCNEPSGGGGHSALRKAHAVFNDRFGVSRLELQNLYCYVAACDGHFFAICNEGGVTKTEVSGARDYAVDADPGDGDSCMYRRFQENYIRYHFGTGDGDFDLHGNRVERRYCCKGSFVGGICIGTIG